MHYLDGNDTPIFIIGSPRSGTTLLRLLLTCHDDIIIPPECGFIVWLHSEFKSWSPASLKDHLMIEEFVKKIAETRKFETWHVTTDQVMDQILSDRPSNYAQLCSCVVRAYARKNGKIAKRWGDKNNFYVNYIRTLRDIYPSAFFIHLVRDGRDVACSYRELADLQSNSPYRPTLPIDIASIALEWKTNVETVKRDLATLSDESKITLKYEDLVDEPEDVLESVCDILNLKFDPKMLEFHAKNQRSELEPVATLDWKRKTLGAVDPKGVGRFKRELTSQERSAFCSYAGDTLNDLGYL